ncbi:LysR family transcriptional regulator, partial [Enterococcus faecalis]
SQYEKLTFKDLKDQRFSSLSDNFKIGRLLLDRTRSFGYEPKIILHNDDLQVLLNSLQKNNSICLLPIEFYEVGKSQGL